MTKKYSRIIFILLISLNIQNIKAQENQSDELLSNTLKIFYSSDIDMDLSDYINSFVSKRMILEIKDSTNFNNPYTKLSKYATIKMSADKKLKLYCWDQRNFGCAWESRTLIQFKTNKKLKTVSLEDFLYMYNLHTIKINNTNHYLLIGYGGHCGNHKYKCARVYKIVNGNLIKTFEICSNSNRRGKLKMSYNSQTKILSYNDYYFDDDYGFYSNKQTFKKLKLSEKGFKKIK